MVNAVVEEVLRRLKTSDGPKPEGPLFKNVSDAVDASVKAQAEWEATPKETKKAIVAALRRVMHDHAEDFARRELDETGLGRYQDKVTKVHNAAEHTPGFEDLEVRSWTGDKGLVYDDYAPYGVVAAITPSTHPVPVLFNSLVMIIVPGNSAVFNVHPAGKSVSAYAAGIFDGVIRQNGGPANLLTMLEEPTVEGASELFRHPAISLIVATGGPALVKAAFESGKKVIAAGPGNPPVLVDETASLRDAARSIIDGASFDNNILCIAEKEAFVVESVFDDFMEAMASEGAVRLTDEQIKLLASKVFVTGPDGKEAVNKEYIGKDASVLARLAGIHVLENVRLLYGEAQFTCKFVQHEQMMPYLPVVRVRDAEEGIRLSVEAEHGYGHTAMIHSNDFETVTRFARSLDTSIVVVNGSSLAGLGGMTGEGTFSHTIASPTGEGVTTPRNYARMRRLAFSKFLQIR
jgi:aldehyde dehydrogenase